MLNLRELLQSPISEIGLCCEISGFFFYRTVVEVSCYLVDHAQDPTKKLCMPIEIGKMVRDQDMTFGTLVGGEYAYYGLECVVRGKVFRKVPGELHLTQVGSMVLGREGECQTFDFGRTRAE